ncbi:hypothetical protein [Dietzia cinnamea]|uniref:hypothetical protein n=1 Tax=Dietzia cinnamea TaxID=321318 RepID=UPI00223C3DB9|nr:hypothetical protein [Dietzia cinnamea]MCT2077445.1 hypothetical protein [Dietzia cinnamea]MCT2221304.1 hypothetical protein [Dietzia cinnamea]
MSRYEYTPCDLRVAYDPEDDDQIPLGEERDWLDLQDPDLIRDIGRTAMLRAQQLVELANHCQDALVEWGQVQKPRGRRLSLAGKDAVFIKGSGDDA